MKKTNLKKLKLAKTTVSQLSIPQQKHVLGGGNDTFTCEEKDTITKK
jgi:hypothetical protein